MRLENGTGKPVLSWLQRDVTLNWLALGLLLAAWNAADDASPATPRPQPLQSYPYVTVRAITRAAAATDPWLRAGHRHK